MPNPVTTMAKIMWERELGGKFFMMLAVDQSSRRIEHARMMGMDRKLL